MKKRPAPPRPSESDLQDAVQHAIVSTGEDDLSLEQFDLEFIGYLTVPQLRGYDDVDAWIDLYPESTDEDLRSFRGAAWAARAKAWVREKSVPPVVVITSRVQPGLFDKGGEWTQIGDGRGRTNLANMFGLRVPVWHLIQRR